MNILSCLNGPFGRFVMVFSSGITCGICYSTYFMNNQPKRIDDGIWSEISEKMKREKMKREIRSS